MIFRRFRKIAKSEY